MFLHISNVFIETVGNLSHCITPFSPRNTLITAEHPTPRGIPYSPWNTLLSAEHFIHRGTPYSPQNTQLIAVQPIHHGTPYSMWTYPTMTTLITQRKRTLDNNCIKMVFCFERATFFCCVFK